MINLQNYFQPDAECASQEDMEKLQSARLIATVKRVYENVPYYREKMDEQGVKPEDIRSINDLQKLPFTKKDDLRDAYPYGLLAEPLSNTVRIQSTSGTTDRKSVV